MTQPAAAVLTLTLSLCVACAPSPAPSGADSPVATTAAPERPMPSAPPSSMFAPFPYSAEEIRAASPAGRVCVLRITDRNGEALSRMEFLDPDEGGVTIHSTSTSEGEEPGEGKSVRSTWEDLVRHASYPDGLTTITKTEVTVEAGTFPARLYEVGDGRGGVAIRAWFADGFGGPPVKLEDIQNDEVMVTMELVEQVLPSAS